MLQGLIARVRTNERGASMVEYGFLVALIAVVCIVVVSGFGLDVQNLFNGITASLP